MTKKPEQNDDDQDTGDVPRDDTRTGTAAYPTGTDPTEGESSGDN